MLASIDIDGTLIPWTKHEAEFDKKIFLKNESELRNNQDKFFYLLNSSRGKHQFYEIANIIKNIPYHAVSLNDGQEIYYPIDFFGKRFLIPDINWKNHLKKTFNWNRVTAKNIIKKTLIESNFKQVKRRELKSHTHKKDKLVYIHQDNNSICKLQKTQNHFLLKTNSTNIFDNFKEKLRQNFLSNNINIDLSHYTKNNHYFIHSSPLGINKSSPISFLIDKAKLYSSITQVITIGDGQNDLSMLSKPFYGKHIKNYPIVINNDKLAEDIKNINGIPPYKSSHINLSLTPPLFNHLLIYQTCIVS